MSREWSYWVTFSVTQIILYVGCGGEGLPPNLWGRVWGKALPGSVLSTGILLSVMMRGRTSFQPTSIRMTGSKYTVEHSNFENRSSTWPLRWRNCGIAARHFWARVFPRPFVTGWVLGPDYPPPSHTPPTHAALHSLPRIRILETCTGLMNPNGNFHVRYHDCSLDWTKSTEWLRSVMYSGSTWNLHRPDEPWWEFLH